MLHERCVVERNRWSIICPPAHLSLFTSQSNSTRFEIQVNRTVETNEYELGHCSTTRGTEPTDAFASVIGTAENAPSVRSLNMEVESAPGDHATWGSVVRPRADDLVTKTAVSNEGLPGPEVRRVVRIGINSRC